jgi:hypothetical protein
MRHSSALPPSEDQADDYASLLRLVGMVSEDHAQLRALLYEFARRKLRRDLYRQFEEGDFTGIQARMSALEDAIVRVESNYAKSPQALKFVAEPALAHGDFAGFALPKSQSLLRQGQQSLRTVAPSTISIQRGAGLAPAADYLAFPAKKIRRQRLWWRFELGIAVLIGAFIFAFLDSQGGLSAFIEGQGGLNVPRLPQLLPLHKQSADVGAGSAQPLANAASSKPQRPAKSEIPLPEDYGAYALADGKLTELSVLPMRVPDPRVAISPTITTPSHAHLSADKVSFVIYRRDLANSVPEHVSVRVIAQVVRALTFAADGKATITNIDETWVVRSNSYEMKIAPVADNPEIVLIRPKEANIVLPAGRYALVLKNVAYDFTIDGSLTDAAHCLERSDALSSPVYSECRNL